MKSTNGKLFLEAYKGEHKIKAKVNSGFATVAQRTKLVGLQLLADYKYGETSYDKGSVFFFREDVLYSQEWAKTVYTCPGVEGEFVIADIGNVICIG